MMNPEMMKMAQEMMQKMSPEDMQRMMEMQKNMDPSMMAQAQQMMLSGARSRSRNTPSSPPAKTKLAMLRHNARVDRPLHSVSGTWSTGSGRESGECSFLFFQETREGEGKW